MRGQDRSGRYLRPSRGRLYSGGHRAGQTGRQRVPDPTPAAVLGYHRRHHDPAHPYGRAPPGKVAAIWRDHKAEALGIAVLSPLSCILVLTALVFTPVSYVAPAREISVLIGVLIGARLLLEKDLRRRLLAASVMLAGVVVLAVG